jgi:PEP-CTERM motif-containing protein
MLRFRALCAAALVTAGTPLGAYADPIQIGGGVRTQPSFGVPNTYELVVATLGLDSFNVPIPSTLTSAQQACSPCSPGQVIDVSTTFTLGGSSLTGIATVDGVGYPQVFGEGELAIHASPITVPAEPGPSPVFRVPAFSFTATGSLRFFDQTTSQLLFDHDVFGSGEVFLFLVGSQGRPIGITDPPYSVYFENYALNQPVPEPGTFVLFGTGALLLSRLSRKRQHPNRWPNTPAAQLRHSERAPVRERRSVEPGGG